MQAVKGTLVVLFSLSAFCFLLWWGVGKINEAADARDERWRKAELKAEKKPSLIKTQGCVGVSSTSAAIVYKCKDGSGGFVTLAVGRTSYNHVALTR